MYCQNCGAKLFALDHGCCGGMGSKWGCEKCETAFFQLSGGIVATPHGERFDPLPGNLYDYYAFKIIARLLSEGVNVDEVLDTELIKLWKYGVKRISDGKLKKSIALYYYASVPKEFFTAPSSSTGKHHPKRHNEYAGIVRHLTESCVLVNQFLRMYGFTDGKGEVVPEMLDIVLAATLLSDTCKNGNPWGERTAPNHGEIAAEQWKKIAESCRVRKEIIDEVYEATYWHLGRWTHLEGDPRHKEFLELNRIQQIVHLLDMISSNKDVNLLYEAKEKIE